MYVIEYVHTSPTRSWLAAGGGGKRGASGEKERGRTHHHTTHARTYLSPLSYQSPKGEGLLSPSPPTPTLIARACPTVLPSIRLSPPSPPPRPCVDLSVARGPRRGGGGGRGRRGATCYLRIVPRGREGEEGRSLLSFCSPLPSFPPPSPSRYVVRGGSVSLIFLFPPLSTPVPCISLASFLTPLLCRYRKIQCYSFFFPQVISVHFAFWLVTTQNSPF